jgi:Flp pilus assembly protein TadG
METTVKFAFRRTRQRGQALVELSIIAPVLIVLGLGTTDFGRVFGLNEAINGAAREAARQAAYYDYTTGTNPDYNDNTAILNVAKQELAAGSTVNLTYQPAPAGVNPCTSSPPASAYPSTAGTGYLYVCRTTGSDGRNHVAVAILWRTSLITPISGITGTPLLHAVVDATQQVSA